MSAFGSLAIGKIGLRAIADKEQIAEHLDALSLHAFAQQRSDRHLQMLAEQIEQGRLDRGHRMNGRAQIEGLQSAAARVAIGKLPLHPLHHALLRP